MQHALLNGDVSVHSMYYTGSGGAAEILDWLSSNPQVPPMLDGAAGAQRDLDPRLVVPADAGVQHRDELIDSRVQPVARLEQLRLQPAEEAFARRVVWRAPLRDIERTIFASAILDTGHR